MTLADRLASFGEVKPLFLRQIDEERALSASEKPMGLLLLVLALLLLPDVPALAEEPNDAEWWTLTDSLTPMQLKAIHEDPTLHRKRYLDAVREGYRAPLPEEKLDRISSFFTGEMTPEILPMWLGFNFLSVRFHQAGSHEVNEKIDSMAAFGFDRSVAERIVQIAVENLEESTRLGRELHEEAWEFALILEEARAILGWREAEKAVEENRVEKLALATSRSPAEVARLKAVWEREPIKEINVKTLIRLRGELSEEQWQLLRSYLLQHIAPGVSTIDFFPVENSP